MQPLFDPADFRLPPGIAHVCAGGEAAALHAHDEALLRYVADKSRGMAGRDAQDAEIEAARTGIGQLWGVNHGDIGFVGNVAEGMSMLVESLDWHEGDSVAIDANEYPSVVAPIALRCGSAIALRQARGTEPTRLAACVDGRTRMIATSYVSYLTGERVDLHALRRLADSAGALLVVDFTRGNPAHCPIYVLNSALSYLSRFDMRDVQSYVQTLTVALLDELDTAGIPAMTPPDPARHGASVCIASPRAQAVVAALRDRGVYAWGGQGRVRISFHGYNGMDDMARTATALRACL